MFSVLCQELEASSTALGKDFDVSNLAPRRQWHDAALLPQKWEQTRSALSHWRAQRQQKVWCLPESGTPGPLSKGGCHSRYIWLSLSPSRLALCPLGAWFLETTCKGALQQNPGTERKEFHLREIQLAPPGRTQWLGSTDTLAEEEQDWGYSRQRQSLCRQLLHHAQGKHTGQLPGGCTRPRHCSASALLIWETLLATLSPGKELDQNLFSPCTDQHVSR